MPTTTIAVSGATRATRGSQPSPVAPKTDSCRTTTSAATRPRRLIRSARSAVAPVGSTPGSLASKLHSAALIRSSRAAMKTETGGWIGMGCTDMGTASTGSRVISSARRPEPAPVGATEPAQRRDAHCRHCTKRHGTACRLRWQHELEQRDRIACASLQRANGAIAAVRGDTRSLGHERGRRCGAPRRGGRSRRTTTRSRSQPESWLRSACGRRDTPGQAPAILAPVPASTGYRSAATGTRTRWTSSARRLE